MLLFEPNTDSKQGNKKNENPKENKSISYSSGLINYTRSTKHSRNVQDLIKEMKNLLVIFLFTNLLEMSNLKS